MEKKLHDVERKGICHNLIAYKCSKISTIYIMTALRMIKEYKTLQLTTGLINDQPFVMVAA